MRALVVSHTGVPGGAAQVILSLLRNRPPAVDAVCAFLDDGPSVASVRALGVEALVLDAGRTREVWRVPWAVARLVAITRSRGIDVVFAHACKAQVYAGPAAAIAGVPSVWCQHDVPGLDRSAPGMTRVLQELAGRTPARLVLCNSDFVAQRHLRRWPRVPVRAVHPGIRTDGVPSREHTRTRDARIVVVGRLQRWKRVDRALDAMRHVLDSEPAVRLRIVGAGRPDVDATYPDELRARAAALGIADAVDFAGDVSAVDDQLADADVLLHTADREAFGLPIAEALLRGIPVVAPPGGGPAQIVRDGVDGVIADPENPARLAAALLRLIGDPAARAAMGAAGRRRVLELFDERRTAATTWRLVAEAAQQRRRT